MICEYCNERVNKLYKCEECGTAVCWECGHDDGTCMVCDKNE